LYSCSLAKQTNSTDSENQPGPDKASGRKVEELENTMTVIVAVAGSVAAEPS